MKRRARLPRIALTLTLGAAILWALLSREALDPSAIESALQALGDWAPAVFVVLWSLWAPLFLPGAALGLIGGALFGPLWGTLWNLTGATLGATLAFLAARYVASGWVAKKAGGRLQQLLDGVEAEGWLFVAVTRLVPLFPFNLLNYALGLTRIRLWAYVLTSLVCMLPGTIAYTYLGFAGREAIAGGEALAQKGLLALGLLALVTLLPVLVRRLRVPPTKWIEVAELKKRLDRGNGVLVVDVRGADEFIGPLGHIPGARNIPVGDLSEQLDELQPFKESPLAMVCTTDKGSAAAAQMLRREGYRDVSVLRSGMEEWRRNRFEVKSTPPFNPGEAERNSC